MNEAKGVKNFDKELKKIVDWVWDNEPRLSKEQDAKGIKFLKNLAFMANGKSRSNTPFGSREEYTLKNFAYFKLRGFHDVSKYGQPEQYVPLYTVYDDEGYGFEYFYHAGKINVVGAKGMSVKNKKTKIETDFFDSDKKVQDFLNLSRVQFMARYKETKERYQQMVNAITRNIEGVFMHGGKMAGAGQFGEGGKMNKYDVIYNSYDQETGDMIADNESIYVMANSISEAKNKAMTMLEEGSRDEDFTIVRVNSMMAKGGHMADGGVTPLSGLIISFPYDREDAYRIKRIIEDHVGMLYADYGDEIYVRVMDDDRGEVSEYDLKQIAKDIRSLNLGVTVESYADGGHMATGGELTYDDFVVGDFYFNSSEGGKFKFVGKDESGRLRFQDSKGIDRIFSPKRMSKYAKGGHMAKGGLTNIKGTTEPKAYPEAEPNTNVVV
jgi:hypothetical protein